MLFAFVPIDGYGHVNSLLGLADALKNRGHKTVFICNDNNSTSSKHDTIILRSAHQLSHSTDILMNEKTDSDNQQDVDRDDISQLDRKWVGAVDALDLKSEPPKQLAINFAVLNHTIKLEVLDMDKRLREVLDKTKPDVVVVDQLCTVPSIMSNNSPYKWVRSQSCNPLSLYWEEYPHLFPAPLLGVPVSGPKADIEKSWSDFRHAISCLGDTMFKLCQQANLSEYKLINKSPYLNLFMYPACLDYHDHLLQASGGASKSLPNWYRCDSLIRAPTTTAPLELPKKLNGDKRKKLIYVSLGTTTSCNVTLMKRLIGILSKSEHKFIVALGTRHRQLEPMPENMWGLKYLDQPKILPLVDLIITHGGNNTITEALYYGVPGIIVCPMFHDQLDNATRIAEKGFGLKLNLFECSEQELLNSINKLLKDSECKQKCRLASKEMQKNEKGAEWAASLLEQVADGKILVGSETS